jgi:type I restriction enzyme R subunit
LHQYTESDKQTTEIDTDLAAQVLLEKYELIKEMLYDHDYHTFFTGKSSEKAQAIVATMDYVIGLGQKRKDTYLALVQKLTRAYPLCATTNMTERLNLEVGFHKAVKASLQI